MTVTCPMCDRGSLQTVVVDETINYAGVKLLVRGIEISRCLDCGMELVLPEQAKANNVLFADAKREHDLLMTSEDIKRWRSDLKLTQAEAAALLGGGINAFSKYERGEVMQSRSMDLLMRVAGQYRDARVFLLERAGLSVAEHDDGSWQRVDSQPGMSVLFAKLQKTVAANEEMSAWHDQSACHVR